MTPASLRGAKLDLRRALPDSVIPADLKDAWGAYVQMTASIPEDRNPSCTPEWLELHRAIRYAVSAGTGIDFSTVDAGNRACEVMDGAHLLPLRVTLPEIMKRMERCCRADFQTTWVTPADL